MYCRSSLGDGAREAVGRLRHHDPMHVVRHQTIGPHRTDCPAARLGENVAVEREVAVVEEHALTPIATLRDMMRQTGHHDADEGDMRLLYRNSLPGGARAGLGMVKRTGARQTPRRCLGDGQAAARSRWARQ